MNILLGLNESQNDTSTAHTTFRLVTLPLSSLSISLSHPLLHIIQAIGSRTSLERDRVPISYTHQFAPLPIFGQPLFLYSSESAVDFIANWTRTYNPSFSPLSGIPFLILLLSLLLSTLPLLSSPLPSSPLLSSPLLFFYFFIRASSHSEAPLSTHSSVSSNKGEEGREGGRRGKRRREGEKERRREGVGEERKRGERGEEKRHIVNSFTFDRYEVGQSQAYSQPSSLNLHSFFAPPLAIHDYYESTLTSTQEISTCKGKINEDTLEENR